MKKLFLYLLENNFIIFIIQRLLLTATGSSPPKNAVLIKKASKSYSMIKRNHSGFFGAKDDKENVFEKSFVQKCIREIPRNLRINIY